jgi:DNA modification methylase
MNNRKAAIVITDPPFGVRYSEINNQRFNIKNGYILDTKHRQWEPLAGDENFDAAINSAAFIYASLVGDGVAYVFCNSYLLIKFATWLNEHNIHYSPFLVWVKPGITISWQRYHPAHEFIIHSGPGSGTTGTNSRWFGDNSQSCIWELDVERQGRLHPTQKPVEIYERALVNSSQRGELIVDCFFGSGTAVIAAEKLGRVCYGMEVDSAWVDVSVRRWENITSHEAILESTGQTFSQVAEQRQKSSEQVKQTA